MHVGTACDDTDAVLMLAVCVHLDLGLGKLPLQGNLAVDLQRFCLYLLANRPDIITLRSNF
jgi:hypothetical protein